MGGHRILRCLAARRQADAARSLSAGRLAEDYEPEPAHRPVERYTVRLDAHDEPVIERRALKLNADASHAVGRA